MPKCSKFLNKENKNTITFLLDHQKHVAAKAKTENKTKTTTTTETETETEMETNIIEISNSFV